MGQSLASIAIVHTEIVSDSPNNSCEKMTSIHDILEACSDLTNDKIDLLQTCLLEVELLDHPNEETKENYDVIPPNFLVIQSPHDSQKVSNQHIFQIDDDMPGSQLFTDKSISTEPDDKCMPLLYDAKSKDSSFLDSSSDSGIEQEDNSNSDIKTISLHDLTNTLDLTTSTCKPPRAHNSTNQKRDADLEVRVENETIADVELSVIENSFSKDFTTTSLEQTQPLNLIEIEQELLPLPNKSKLSREEEINLKKIRRKLRNRETAQDSRKRKKKYLEDLEAQVKSFADENCKLRKQVEQLKAQMTTNNQNLNVLYDLD